MIKQPTKEEVARIETGQVCGNCDFFEYEAGQSEIRRQQFVERMVQDEGWKRQWLENPNAMGVGQFGMCGQSDDTAVPMTAAACDQWRERRKGILRAFYGGLKKVTERT